MGGFVSLSSFFIFLNLIYAFYIKDLQSGSLVPFHFSLTGCCLSISIFLATSLRTCLFSLGTLSLWGSFSLHTSSSPLERFQLFLFIHSLTLSFLRYQLNS